MNAHCLDDGSTLLTIGYQGPPGIPGPPGERGAPGAAGAGFDFEQPTPALIWQIDHFLDRRPDVRIETPDGRPMNARAVNPNTHQTLIYFRQPRAGRARLN